MKRLIKTLIVGVVLCFSSCVFAEEYKVLVLPDNIVTEDAALDSYIYDASAEFFADGIVNILNETDNIKSPNVSQVRTVLKKEPTSMLLTKNMTNRFKAGYNVDYEAVKKIAQKTKTDYVLLLTSTIDAQNFILRRTWWDFFNIPGASVIDPAYKINTYAVLVDTRNNTKLWSDTYYKTISTVENRIITQGPSPQTVQLEKIKDYSRYLCPQIAQQVQLNVLPWYDYLSETKKINYSLGDFDNVFTKKYRHYRKETAKAFSKKKNKTQSSKVEEVENTTKLEVEAKPVYDNQKDIQDTKPVDKESVKNTACEKSADSVNQSTFDAIDIRKTRKNNLYGSYDSDRLPLRDYTK